MCYLRILLKRLILATVIFFLAQSAEAALVKFGFSGKIATTWGNYTTGETFSGFYVIDSETVGVRLLNMYSSGDWITEFAYYNAVVDFEMNFADKSITFEPDGAIDLNGSDSTIIIRNDQRFTTYDGSNYYYSDRFLATFNDTVGSKRFVESVQFDWYDSSSTGMPDLLTSTELPLTPTDYTVVGHQGRIFADGNLNIFFDLTSMEVVPVPAPASVFLLLSGFALLAGWIKRMNVRK